MFFKVFTLLVIIKLSTSNSIYSETLPQDVIGSPDFTTPEFYMNSDSDESQNFNPKIEDDLNEWLKEHIRFLNEADVRLFNNVNANEDPILTGSFYDGPEYPDPIADYDNINIMNKLDIDNHNSVEFEDPSDGLHLSNPVFDSSDHKYYESSMPTSDILTSSDMDTYHSNPSSSYDFLRALSSMTYDSAKSENEKNSGTMFTGYYFVPNYEASLSNEYSNSYDYSRSIPHEFDIPSTRDTEPSFKDYNAYYPSYASNFGSADFSNDFDKVPHDEEIFKKSSYSFMEPKGSVKFMKYKSDDGRNFDTIFRMMNPTQSNFK